MEVIFYRPRGHKEPAVLWDAEKGKPVYEFFQGIFKSSDKKVIARMRELGFPEQPVSINEQVLLDQFKDRTAEPPPPPPKETMVPKVEPKVKVRAPVK